MNPDEGPAATGDGGGHTVQGPGQQPPPHIPNILGVTPLLGQDTVAILALDQDGVVVQANAEARRITGRTLEGVLGAQLEKFVHPRDLETYVHDLERLRRGRTVNLDLTLRVGRPGSWNEVRCGLTGFPTPTTPQSTEPTPPANIVMLMTPAPARLTRAGATDQTLFDPLTRLVSRPLLLDMLADHLRRRRPGLVVVLIDLDRFKAVNDSLGQATGDAVLVEMARRLRGPLHPADVAARLGGDDFCIIYADVESRPRVAALVQQMLDLIAEPITIQETTMQISGSAGVVMVDPDDDLSADTAISQATAALTSAKASGRARFAIHDRKMAVSAGTRLTLETALRSALENRTLTVAYQPIRALASGRLDGAEALARWVHPRLGTVGPEAFMPIAEETGLAEPLTSFVLEEAISAAMDWRTRSGADLHVAVNLSAQDLDRRGIASEIAGYLGRAGLPPRALRLEIVETLLVEAGNRLLGNLGDLRDLGVGIGIDDFGTGYSSMSYVKHLPIDFVKIDRSFVDGLGVGREDTAIVRAVIGLAHSLDLTVVAEGIENPTQMRLLRELGCDLGQGFLLGHAEPADVLARSLQTPGPLS